MDKAKIVQPEGRKVAYFSPLRIPEAKKGKFTIKHKTEQAGAKLTVVSHRDAIFWSVMGRKVKAQDLILDRAYCIHQLQEEGRTWMSDCPQEIMSQRWQIERFKGNVLVGGLGLGWAITELEQNPKVKCITVIENSKDVVDLVWKHLSLKKSELIVEDLYKFLKQSKKLGLKWDYGYYDIWCPTGERVLNEHVRPLRKLSEGIIKQKNLECWEELTMLGQIKFNLYTTVQMWNEPQPHHSWQNIPEKEFPEYRRMFQEKYAFINWMRQTKPSQDEAMFMLNHYVNTYSDPKLWSKTWERWDK